MSNHNKIRPVDKNNLNGQYKILFSTPQTPNSNIPKEFRGLQIFPNKIKAEEALRNRKKLTKTLKEKRAEGMIGNKNALGNSGGDKSNLIQYNPQIQKLKNIFAENIRQFNVYHNDEIVAGTTIFQTKNVIHIQYIGSDTNKNKLGSLDFLFYKLINELFTDYKFFDFGTSNENNGRKINHFHQHLQF